MQKVIELIQTHTYDFFIPLTALALLCACSSGEKKTPPTRPADFVSSERQFTAPASGDIIAIFDTSLGEVRAVLYPDAAPMAVYNFVGLARSGYYDNTTIWRSEYGFAVQGGDATGTGTGGSTIWSNNPYPLEADAGLKHYAGALCAAFAAGGDATGGNSQFYFVTALPDSVSSSDLQAELTANGYNGDKLAATGTLVTAGKPVELRLRAERTAIAPDGLGHAEIALFDAAGTRCAVTDAVVHLRVSGDGSLFGVSNGDTTSPQPFKSNAVRLFEGRALAVVRAGLRPGECRLRAVCEIDGAELASELAFSVG